MLFRTANSKFLGYLVSKVFIEINIPCIFTSFLLFFPSKLLVYFSFSINYLFVFDCFTIQLFRLQCIPLIKKDHMPTNKTINSVKAMRSQTINPSHHIENLCGANCLPGFLAFLIAHKHATTCHQMEFLKRQGETGGRWKGTWEWRKNLLCKLNLSGILKGNFYKSVTKLLHYKLIIIFLIIKKNRKSTHWLCFFDVAHLNNKLIICVATQLVYYQNDLAFLVVYFRSSTFFSQW